MATVDGKELTALRVDGWQQAWLLPASQERDRVELRVPRRNVRTPPC